jgi:threonine dehydratase
MIAADTQMLFNMIMRARGRIYRLSSATPIEKLRMPNNEEIFLKREDLSPNHSYKWRGAFNMMISLDEKILAKGVVTASAGNHAQGVALSAHYLGCKARVFMPSATPKMKIHEVERLGCGNVEIVIGGDNYDEASKRAKEYASKEKLAYIPPYDHLEVMAGQGTIGDEIVMSGITPQIAFLQIGGGGMAAGVACVLKTYYPDIHIIGVEGEGQASMLRAVEAGQPVELEHLDVFCDGTAVRKTSESTLAYCSKLIDEFMTVSNNEVCAAIQLLWESARLIAEPSGAMGVAAVMKRQDAIKGKRVLAILSGANMDFTQLAFVAAHSGIGLAQRRYYRFEIPEKPRAILNLLESVLEGINIIDFQYGKVEEKCGYPVIGFEASSIQLDLLHRRLSEKKIRHADVTSRSDVEFRIIHYHSELFKLPYFAIIEFPERAGALYEFMRQAGSHTNIVYFNYETTGEQVGRAMMGFEFDSEKARNAFLEYLKTKGPAYKELPEEVLKAIL